MKGQLKALLWWLLPDSIRTKLIRRTRWPPVGELILGDLRQIRPISRDWGFDRGKPVDRYYIERFLSANSLDIQRRVLEIADNAYTCRFGADRVTKSDILHITEGNPKATIIGDLACADHIPSDSFDCIICTQTLHLVYRVESAIQTLNRILKPGGVLLVTVPGISQISRDDMDRWGDYWRFTSASARRIFSVVFPNTNIHIQSYGNVLAAIGFLHGLAAEELYSEELDYFDPDYELIITIRAEKPY